MKKIGIVLLAGLLIASSAVFVYAQIDSGFLDAPAPAGGVWYGNGFYCIDRADPTDLQDDYVVAACSPLNQACDCSIY